jgi:mRNA-degrading endonuclease YafQ of YafQ-DinJ toxin-antitoxin module
MKKIFNEVRRLVEFEKDFKRLSKKFRTLEEDLETFIQNQLNLYHKLHIDNRGIFPISDLGISYPKIFKAKKFACRFLKGKGVASGIRVIYAYFEQEDVIELVEIYYKGEKENEDRNRLLWNYRDRTIKNKNQD